MGKKDKKQNKKNRVYTDSYDDYSNKKKFKNSRFDNDRKNKEVQHKIFWD